MTQDEIKVVAANLLSRWRLVESRAQERRVEAQRLARELAENLTMTRGQE